MLKIKSLKTRLALWYTCIFGSITLIFGIILVLLIRGNLLKCIDRQLLHETNNMLLTLNIIDNQIHITDETFWTVPDHLFSSIDALFIETVSKNGTVLKTSQNCAEDTLKIDVKQLGSIYKDSYWNDVYRGSNVRIFRKPILVNKNFYGWILVFKYLTRLENTTRLIKLFIIGVFPIAIVLAYLGATIIAKTSLKPVKNFSDEARKISSTNLSTRIPVPEINDEIRHMILTLNNLLDRLEKSFNLQKQFSEDSSHELKTPLTIMKGELEELMQTVGNNNTIKKHLLNIGSEIQRMQKTVDNLITISKLDTKQIRLEKKEVWLNDIIINEIERYYGIMAEKNIQLDISNLHSTQIKVDPNWTAILFSNIIDNAVKFSLPDGKISIGTIDNHKSVSIKIQDSGPGIPTTEYDKVKQRFYYSSSNSSHGSGLGLAICDQIMKYHDGDMTIKNVSSGGLEVTLSFPK